MGQILKNGIKYTSGFFGRLRGKFISETPPNDGYNWDVTIPPAESQYHVGFEIQDATGVRTTHLDTHARTDGGIATVLGVEKVMNGEPVRNQLYINVLSDGTLSYGVDDPSAFRYAIGLRDAVIEQGTSGIWTYRRWSSGISECWGMTSSTNYAVTNAYVNGWYANLGTVNLPTGLFVAAPVIEATRTNTGSGSALIFLSLNNVTASSFAGFVSATSSGTYPCQFSYHAIGRWRN